MTIAEVKKKFTQTIRDLKDPVTVTRRSKPVAVILSMDEYEKLLWRASFESIMSYKQQLSRSGVTAEKAHGWAKAELEGR
ncbi:MAG: type II toxin-antitoxin system Phd/YefM family antitoxin [Armatimonadetes bacterium]|nr:type II toxin-antitoxin system Phd/YefM family antitoxin [Armatimonadota bacterium]